MQAFLKKPLFNSSPSGQQLRMAGQILAMAYFSHGIFQPWHNPAMA
jgi:hypothetical protein